MRDEPSGSKSKRANAIALKVAAAVFAAVVVASFTGQVDAVLNAFADWGAREDLNRFARAVSHLIGPRNPAGWARENDALTFLGVVLFVGGFLSYVAFAFTKFVLDVTDETDKAASGHREKVGEAEER